jgi:hypothetical protein
MKPTNSSIGRLLLCAAVGAGMVLICGWDILRHFSSTDLSEPFRRSATHFNQPAVNFVVFSSFVWKMTLDVFSCFVGATIVVLAALKAGKHLVRSASP